ncbi:Alpha/Beta hydrolase protein [Gymnopilus junonius]|uniref:acylaminoacyl-peptidase n=1 Tax=Gymnopilus junonius TaxID=109634 RepID=A0A9P5NNS9_GYMJU|nr:Alpha/Beta hydrolase protein [Gymnopilus junonius]
MYTQLAEIPLPTSAQFITRHDPDGSATVEVSYSLRDHIRNSKRTVSRSIVFSSEASSIPTVTPLQEVDPVVQLVSPSTKRRAVLRSRPGGSRFIEIWSNGLLEASMEVTDYHGDFYADEYLGSLSFAPSEAAILYTAEGKAPESDDPFEKFRFNPDFGEGLGGKRRPTLFLFSWQTDGKKSLVQLNAEAANNIRFGQAVFSPNSERIVYATGYEFTVDDRILGPKGCYNRPIGIWQLYISVVIPNEETKKPLAKLDVKPQKLSPPHLSCRSPRILKQVGSKKSSLVWLADKTGGPHLGTSSLFSLDISSDFSTSLDVPPNHEPLVGVVDTPQPDGFPGLYPSYGLPTSPSILLPTSSSIVVHSFWGSRSTVLQISGADGKVKNLTPISNDDSDLYSWSVLATDGYRRIICSRSSPSVPYEIMLGQFNEDESLSWRSLDKPALPESFRAALASITTKIIPIPGRHPVETILIQGKSNTGDSVPPCITSPHGGPHGVTTTAFSPTTTALVLAGYTLSLPNYTGSPGFGDTFLQGLVGKCGQLDVQDCIASARHLVSIGVSREGPGLQLITGGSHGGFLTAHLIGQFPKLFSAAIMRNPVISVGEISTSDIRDWYFSEFALPYPLSSSPSNSSSSATDANTTDDLPPIVLPETYKILYEASPISFVDNVCIPVLLLIGAADRRVAPTQGIDYYHALKARFALRNKGQADELKVDMLVFEGESHPLDGVEAAKVSFEATKKWFGDAVTKGRSR